MAVNGPRNRRLVDTIPFLGEPLRVRTFNHLRLQPRNEELKNVKEELLYQMDGHQKEV